MADVLTIKNPAGEIFDRWSELMEPVVGEGNATYGTATDQLNGKGVFARLTVADAPTWDRDISGNECALNVAVLVEIYSTEGLNSVYDVDYESHKILASMGLERSFGPELIDNIESNIKRLVSRYTIVYAGSFL